MIESEGSKPRRLMSGSKATPVGRLFVLDLSGSRVFSLNADGSDFDPLRGNTVNRGPMDGDLRKRQAPEILLSYFREGIGIALDLKGERMFLTDLGGSVYSAKLNGSDKKTLLYAEGNLTGIAYAELPSSNLV